ncbi:MAG: amidohydrolase [Candidatus Bathyarchaeia archaeon]
MYADLILFNGKIITVDEKETIAEAVAVKDGRIVSVGLNDEVLRMRGAETKTIDLKGKTIVPGFIDSHCHMLSTGLGYVSGNLDLSEEGGVSSIVDLKSKIKERASKTPKGEWIVGVKEDDQKLSEKRHPTRWELDEAAPEHPVIVSTVGGHFSIVNSCALKLAGVDKSTQDPEGGVFDRDPVTGELTGGVHEKAQELFMPEGVFRKGLTREEAATGAKRILEENASAGLTCVYDMAGGPEIRSVLDLMNRGELPIRVRIDAPIELFPELSKIGIIQGIGNEWVKICGLKTFLDGAISARTAAVSEPYLNRKDFYGVFSTTKESARRSILEACKEGYRISIHANGDRAIDMCLDIMEEMHEKYDRMGMRDRIIHCTVVNPRIVERIKRLGVLPTIFGAYAYYHGDKLIPAFGEERLERMFAARWLLDAGIRVAAHSDHSASPFPPLMGIHSLVNRASRTGKPVGASQRIAVIEALKLYTINAAYQSFDEALLGSIEVGKLADLVVLGRDLLTEPKESIKDIPIDMTIVGGKIVYKRGGSA